MTSGHIRSDLHGSLKSCLFDCLTCPYKKLSLFEHLEPRFLEKLNLHKSTVIYRAGELLYKEGNKIQGLLCLQSGKIKEYKIASTGNEMILALKKPVEFIGLPDLLIHSSHRSSAMALEDTAICIIDKSDFLSVLHSNPAFMMEIYTYLSRAIESTQNHMLQLTQKHMRGRVAYALVYLKEFYGLRKQDACINLSLKRADLAALTNLTTSNVIRTLAAFAAESLIEINGRNIRILDEAKTRQIHELS